MYQVLGEEKRLKDGEEQQSPGKYVVNDPDLLKRLYSFSIYAKYYVMPLKMTI